MKKETNDIKDIAIDIPLLLIVAALVVFGLLMLYSASWDVSWRAFKDVNRFFIRQLVWLAIGIISAAILCFLDYHRWDRNKFAVIAIGVTILLLLIVLFVGKGSARSLLGGKSVQPSELAKFVIVIYLAVWLNSKGEKIKQVGFGLIPLGAILGIVGGLIAVQTDVSAAVTVFFLGFLLFFMAGGSLIQLLFLVVASGGLGTAIVAYRKPEVSQRILDFWYGIKDVNTIGSEQIEKSFTAFMDGGWFGVGLGRGVAKLVLLPVPHTDSIFAVVGEELGVFGASCLVLLFGVFLWRGMVISRKAADGLGSLLAAGLTFWIVFEAFVNIAVIIGLLPVAGNPLPFVSLGGSNLVVTMSAVGLILGVGRYAEVEKRKQERRSLGAVVDLRGRDGRRRLSSPGRSPVTQRR
ncbi:MAG: cell division protein FtsW [Anaerolineales bacterium]|nr:cell division protein FtsW [Anaerolineales bacterium]MBS3752558.1 cell division protein FtsW [Anaerolineales bacterium]